MKSAPLAGIFLLAISSALFSCAPTKQNSLHKNALAISKEPEKGCFVKYADGSLRNFSSIHLVTGVFTSPHLVADDSIKILPGQILAYQNDLHYAVSQKLFSSGHRTVAAVETLPGFAVRVVKGDINVFCKKYFNGNRAINEYFIQQGSEGKILAYDETTMKEMIKGNPEVSNLLSKKKTVVSRQSTAANLPLGQDQNDSRR